MLSSYDDQLIGSDRLLSLSLNHWYECILSSSFSHTFSLLAQTRSSLDLTIEKRIGPFGWSLISDLSDLWVSSEWLACLWNLTSFRQARHKAKLELMSWTTESLIEDVSPSPADFLFTHWIAKTFMISQNIFLSLAWYFISFIDITSLKFSLRTPYRTGLVQAEETPTMWKRRKKASRFLEASNKSVVSATRQNKLGWEISGLNWPHSIIQTII